MRGAILGVLLIAACSGGDGGRDDAATTTTTTTTTIPRTPGAEAPLTVGQCGDVPQVPVGGALDPATFVPIDCNQPHDVEVAAVFDFPAGVGIDFPGTATVDGYADDQCLARFEAYVGSPYESSSLDVFVVAPDEDGWDDGDRRLACILYQVDFQDLTGPVAASGL